MGVDGCGAPCHAMPLRSAALTYARLANPAQLDDRRREACGCIAQAMIRYPYLIGGSERFDTVMLAVGGGRWVNKGGAMGYFAAGISAEANNTPLGIALKIEDGSHQAACQMAVSIFDQLGLLDDRRRERLSAWVQIPVKSSMDHTAGYSRAEFDLETDV
jgi:L-asparaginase II